MGFQMFLKALASTFLLLALIAWGKPANAWLNTAELQAVCQAALKNPAPDNPRYTLCAGILLGVLISDSLEKKVICAPQDLDTKTALQVFVARAADEKSKEIDGIVTLFRALEAKYPCPPQK